jgi:hypothetical protein
LKSSTLLAKRGLTFQEWDQAQAAEKSQEPAPMMINSSQLRAAGFKLDMVISLHLRELIVLVCAREVLIGASFGVWGPKGLC